MGPATPYRSTPPAHPNSDLIMAEIALKNGARRVLSGYELPRRIVIPREGKSMDQIEAEAISHTLDLTEGNRSAASRILGISRPTLLRKIRKHGLS